MISASFPVSSSRPSEIVIMPVSNGWIVRIPVNEISSFTDQMKSMASVIKDTIHGDPGDLEQIIKAANVSRPVEQSSKMVRDFSLHIFPTFKEVLEFLRYEIQAEEETDQSE